MSKKSQYTEVAKILSHRIEKGKVFYKVRWANCEPDEDTWEPRESFIDKEPIVEYEAHIVRKKKAMPEQDPNEITILGIASLIGEKNEGVTPYRYVYKINGNNDSYFVDTAQNIALTYPHGLLEYYVSNTRLEDHK